MFSYLPVPASIPTWKLKAFWILISTVSNPAESQERWAVVLVQGYLRCIFCPENVAHEQATVNLACVVDKDWRLEGMHCWKVVYKEFQAVAY